MNNEVNNNNENNFNNGDGLNNNLNSELQNSIPNINSDTISNQNNIGQSENVTNNTFNNTMQPQNSIPNINSDTISNQNNIGQSENVTNNTMQPQNTNINNVGQIENVTNNTMQPQNMNINYDMMSNPNSNVNQNGNFAPIGTQSITNDYPNNNQYNDMNSTNNGKNNKSKIVIIIILLVLVLASLGAVSYKLISDYTNPKIRLAKSMTKYLKSSNIENDAQKIYKMLDNGFTINVGGNIKASYAEEEMLNVDYNLNVVDNPNESKQYYNLKLSEKAKELINFEGLVQNNKLYLTIKGAFKNYYFTDFEYVKLYDNNSEKLINNVKISLNEYFTEDKFITNDETINMDGKDIKVKKITLNITEKMMNELAIKVLENLNKDDESLKCLVSKDTTLEDIKSTIDEELKSLKESLPTSTADDPIVYTSYIKSYDILKQQIVVGDYTFTITGTTSGDINISDKNSTIISGSYDEKTIKLTYKEDETVTNINIDYNEQILDNKMTGTYKINANMKSGSDSLVFDVGLNLELNNQNTIPNINVSNAKDINEITEEDYNALIEKAMDLPLIKDYYSAIGSAVDSYDTSIDDYESELDDCDYAFNCQANEEGKYNCSHYNDDFEEESIVCDTNNGLNF